MPNSSQQAILRYGTLAQLKRAGKESLLWLDLELTGLDLAKDKIVEVAVIASDMQLKVFLEGPHLVVNPELERQDYHLSLNEWCTQTFRSNGLDAEILKSETSFKKAEAAICEFVQSISFEKDHTWYLAGSSVHVDRQFLCQEMPNLIKLLSYRIVDVSSMATMAWRWSSKIMRNYTAAAKYSSDSARDERREETFLSSLGLSAPRKNVDQESSDDATSAVNHRAQYDIIQSIALLRYIKDNVFKKGAA